MGDQPVGHRTADSVRERLSLPTDEYGWTAYMATGLALVLYSESWPEARKIASEFLLDLIDLQSGAPYINQETRLRWYMATQYEPEEEE